MKTLRVLIPATAILMVPALIAGCNKGPSQEELAKKQQEAAKGPGDKDDHSIRNE